MAKEGLEYLTQFIDPNIRQRFSPAVQGIARLFAPTPYTPTATKDLLTSTANINKTGIKPIIDSTGRFLTTGVTQALEANPAFRPVVKGSKFVSNLAEEAIEAATKKLAKEPVITASENFLTMTKKNTPLNVALKKIGEEKISQMTIPDLRKLLEKNYDIKVSDTAIRRKNITKAVATGEGSGNKLDIIRQAFNSVKNPEQYTTKDLANIPEIKKAIEETGISFERFASYKSDLGIKSTANFFGRVGVNEQEVIDYIKDNPRVTTPQLQALFPKLSNVSEATLSRWRNDNKIVKVNKPKTNTRREVLIDDNPELQKQLDFISQSGDKPLPSNIPIKHKEAFSRIITINKDGKPLDFKRTKIVKAHGIGEGGVKGSSGEIIKSKVAMIPDKFLEEVKLPKFFLTRTGNDLHGDIEDNLILALVNKYDKLGYNFIDGAWKQTKKVNSKSINKELRGLENEIAGYKKELNDLDAYTLFYNPIKDKMVTYGKSLSEIPGLSNLLNKVQKGEKKLRYGGLVGIDRMTRSLREF